MPTEAQSGDAILWGMRADGSAITIDGYATFILSSAKLDHKADIETMKDETGFDRNKIATNSRKEGTFAFTPSGASRADAEAVAVCPSALTKLVISGWAVDEFNGNWLYEEGASIDLSQKAGSMTLKLVKYDDDTQNDLLTTTVP